jgi:hypothetical protein
MLKSTERLLKLHGFDVEVFDTAQCQSVMMHWPQPPERMNGHCTG